MLSGWKKQNYLRHTFGQHAPLHGAFLYVRDNYSLIQSHCWVQHKPNFMQTQQPLLVSSSYFLNSNHQIHFPFLTSAGLLLVLGVALAPGAADSCPVFSLTCSNSSLSPSCPLALLQCALCPVESSLVSLRSSVSWHVLSSTSSHLHHIFTFGVPPARVAVALLCAVAVVCARCS